MRSKMGHTVQTFGIFQYPCISIETVNISRTLWTNSIIFEFQNHYENLLQVRTLGSEIESTPHIFAYVWIRLSFIYCTYGMYVHRIKNLISTRCKRQGIINIWRSEAVSEFLLQIALSRLAIVKSLPNAVRQWKKYKKRNI